VVTWETFKNLRKLNVEKWLVNRGITSYDLLVEKLKIVNVMPPSLEVYNSFKPVMKFVTKQPDVVQIIDIAIVENKDLEVSKADIQITKQAIIEVSGTENTPQKKRKKTDNESK
jgi:hypothetical protein